MKFRYATFAATIAFLAPAAFAWAADGDAPAAPAAPAAAAAAPGAPVVADAAAGELKFKQKCGVCHLVGPNAKTKVGPELNGVVGRHSGTVEGFAYSDANKNSGLTWDVATLMEYLINPRAKVPGTKMIFPGLPDEQDRANVIAYLGTFNADGSTK